MHWLPQREPRPRPLPQSCLPLHLVLHPLAARPRPIWPCVPREPHPARLCSCLCAFTLQPWPSASSGGIAPPPSYRSVTALTTTAEDPPRACITTTTPPPPLPTAAAATHDGTAILLLPFRPEPGVRMFLHRPSLFVIICAVSAFAIPLRGRSNTTPHCSRSSAI
ncbi:hypothetical protein K505DRAFT_160254 [Melanomma pulvis-pyrius CBS 109.77]|uniref:Uncharacterized protein n=1 Tax=Melanomma pulvis-pyrius CBS 109.77 TaxID=1314802 RepID=A0A6A6XJB6_9PLEO|nr:hypothetical protein K505DRAFT_160254 [Melanomma pulvis-pyrius CBS 109.77]